MEENGVWRTVGGRRIFIKEGQDLASAMKESGKFNQNNKNSQVKKNLDNNVKEYYDKFDESGVKPTNFISQLDNIDEKWANENLEILKNLSSEYYSNATYIGYKIENKKENALGVTKTNEYNMSQIYLLNEAKDRDSAYEHMKNSVLTGYHPQTKEEDYAKQIITHEFAHTLVNTTSSKYHKEAFKELDNLYNEYKREIHKQKELTKELGNKLLFEPTQENFDKALKQQKEYERLKISDYAYRTTDEFIAESFVDAKLGANKSEYSLRAIEIIDKYFKKEK